MGITFRQFVENLEAQRSASREMILNTLRDQLNVTDDEVILQMRTTDISDKVISDLMSRGLIDTNDPALLDRIKNGMTIGELVDAVARY